MADGQLPHPGTRRPRRPALPHIEQSADRQEVFTVRHIRQRCPICEGRKHVPAGFYIGIAGSTNPEPCQQCGATGMIAATETESRSVTPA